MILQKRSAKTLFRLHLENSPAHLFCAPHTFSLSFLVSYFRLPATQTIILHGKIPLDLTLNQY